MLNFSGYSNKTWKRELAIGLFLWLVYLAETKDVQVIELVVWPVFTFGALAFGLEWFGKSGGMQQSITFTSRRGSKDSS